MKIFICASKHLYYKIPEIKKYLEKQGNKITLPNSFDRPFKEEEMKKISKEEHIKFKQKMMKLQESKIKKQDAILVLNFEKKGIPNYIGGATFMEIIKAWELNKKIFFYNPVPKCAFTDELNGINPIILN
jgi:DNA-binding transcriptional MerR regulator